jgi:hypothetical protein
VVRICIHGGLLGWISREIGNHPGAASSSRHMHHLPMIINRMSHRIPIEVLRKCTFDSERTRRIRTLKETESHSCQSVALNSFESVSVLLFKRYRGNLHKWSHVVVVEPMDPTTLGVYERFVYQRHLRVVQCILSRVKHLGAQVPYIRGRHRIGIIRKYL